MLLPHRRSFRCRFTYKGKCSPRNVSFLNLQLAVNMIFLKHFLTVKIADRIQQISRERCEGCAGNYILDNFHACVKTSLEERIRIFLPIVKAEALDKIDNLIALYQQAAWVENEVVRQSGVDIISSISQSDLQDRRFINEDTVQMHPFNMSWLNADCITESSVTPDAPSLQPPVKKPALAKNIKNQSKPNPKNKPTSSKRSSSDLNEMEEQILAKFNKMG